MLSVPDAARALDAARSRCGASSSGSGVAQLGDGLVALPADARTREQLEWMADEVVEAAGGCRACGSRARRPAAQERRARAGDGAARAAEYAGRRAEARPLQARPRRTGRRRGAPAARPSCAAIGRRDFFPPAERDAAAPPSSCRALDDAARQRRRASGTVDEVGDARRRAHRPGRVRLADPPRRRPRRGVRVRRRPGRRARRRDPVRHARASTLSHHGGDCTFETILRRYDLTDPVLWRIAEIVHEADLDDDRYDAPEAPGLDVVAARRCRWSATTTGS